jgi:zinc transport system permease protein
LSLIVGICVGGAAGFLGSLMLGRRMALVAGPLGHLTLPGIALALMYGFDVSLGAFPFVIFGIVLIWLFEMRTKLPMEALTAVVFASGVAIAFLLLPIQQAEAVLVGDITKVSFAEAAVSVILILLLFFVVKKIY